MSLEQENLELKEKNLKALREVQKLENETQTLRLKLKQADQAESDASAADLVLAEKDSKIEQLCDTIQDLEDL